MNRRRAPEDAAPSTASRLHQLTNRLRGHRVVHKLWAFLDEARATARGVAHEHLPEVTSLGRRLAERMLAEPDSGRHPVVNASGVVLPDWVDLALPVAAIEKMAQQACAMTTGQAGPEETGRDLHAVRHLIKQLTGADSALVLHNEAAALTAVFAGLAAGGEVVAARGHVGCIDRRGPVLLTDVITAGGARLHEVGSVEHVSAEDYRLATGKPAALVLHATPAHYAVAGAASSTTLHEVIEVSHRAGLPVVDFLPAALLVEITGFAWSGPVVGQSLIAGADIVVFNGYRYLGGPPCGIVAGRSDLIQRIAAHPLARMLAADRLTVAALEATLELTRDRSAAERAIPLWQLLTATSDALRNRAQRLAPQVANCTRVARAEVVDTVAYVGPGQLPSQQLRDWCVAVDPTSGPPEQLAEVLRSGIPSVWAAVEHGRVVIHLRGVLARDDEQITAAFNQLGTRTAVVGGTAPISPVGACISPTTAQNSTDDPPEGSAVS
jgi:L-seryl-tRNA(Ser) seleniumtransferase